MAEFLGIPYTDVMIAAFIPAIVYFAGVWAGICVEAKRLGLGRIPLELLPKAKEIFLSREMMAFVISLGVLIYLLLLYLPPPPPPKSCAAWALIVGMALVFAHRWFTLPESTLGAGQGNSQSLLRGSDYGSCLADGNDELCSDGSMHDFVNWFWCQSF